MQKQIFQAPSIAIAICLITTSLNVLASDNPATPSTDPSERDGANSLPGLVPDPLFPATGALIGPKESRSYWITLRIPADAKPGKRELKFRFILGDSKEVTELPLTLEVSPFVIQPRRDFHVIHWTRGEANWDYYKTEMFDDRWWDITRSQL